MMQPLTLFAVADACGVARSEKDAIFSGVKIDSRQVVPGDLFVALRGDRFDAHDFLADVQKAGAVAAVVEKIDAALSLPQLPVNDVVGALGNIAAMNRALFKGTVIGLTGSAGKTTTKEMIAAIVRQQKKPLVTQGNLNNHIGVPLTLLSLSPEHDSAVIEMGASALGEIQYLANMAKPDVALVTNVGAAHLEGFGSIENVAIGKREIFSHLSADGVAVINLDNAWTVRYIEQLPPSIKRVTYSMEKPADIFASHIEQSAEGLRFVLHANTQQRNICLNFLGLHNVGNALAAAACCLAAGLSLDVVEKGLQVAMPYKGRLQTRKGIRGCRIIDDSYNANPASMRAAIDVLQHCDGEQVLVLGDMGELGNESEMLHADIGVYAKKAGVKTLCATGNLSAATVSAFGKGAMHFQTYEQLLDHCSVLANKQTIFLIKGSRSAGMDRVADRLADNGATIC